MKETNAKDIKGFLLYSPVHKSHFFRVYNKTNPSTFKDYRITAEDIEIQLLSKFNALIEYEDSRGNLLDYSSDVVRRING